MVPASTLPVVIGRDDASHRGFDGGALVIIEEPAGGRQVRLLTRHTGTSTQLLILAESITAAVRTAAR